MSSRRSKLSVTSWMLISDSARITYLPIQARGVNPGKPRQLHVERPGFVGPELRPALPPLPLHYLREKQIIHGVDMLRISSKPTSSVHLEEMAGIRRFKPDRCEALKALNLCKSRNSL